MACYGPIVTAAGIILLVQHTVVWYEPIMTTAGIILLVQYIMT